MPSPRLVAVLLALALSAGCFGDDRPAVETTPVSSGEVVERVSAPARVDAAARQDVAAAVSGVVVALDAADGDAVVGAQPVVRLESSQVDLAREQAAAAQSAAAAAGITVDGGGDASRARTAEAVAQLDAETRPRIAEARARAGEVAADDQRAAALSAVDAVEASYLTTRAALLAAGDAVAAGQDQTAASLTDALNQAVAQATAAQRAQADAAAAVAARQADGLVAVAPFDGTIQLGGGAATDGAPAAGLPPGLELPPGLAGGLTGLPGAAGGGTLRVGAPVTAGQTLFTVYDLSTLYVTADVDEVDAPTVGAGQPATVLIDAFSEVEFDGVVESVDIEAATTEAGGVGFPARVRITGPDTADLTGVRVGMTASVEIATRTVDAALVVPSRALVRRDDGTVVFVVRDGRAEAVEVTVAVLGDERAAVDGDLARDEAVVVSGFEGLGDGDEVRAGAPSADSS
ncbi:MAG: efflux RND transporter periplasmic adaptor subunit [Egibacteraceae bacterium]